VTGIRNKQIQKCGGKNVCKNVIDTGVTDYTAIIADNDTGVNRER
jgi:hypothetical protein